MRRARFLSVLGLVLVLTLSLGSTSCGGGGSGSGGGDLVLVSFNLPNISGIPLNQPLIFTFNKAVDPASITPDTLRVIGAAGPFFEQTIVDGNLVSLLPTIPNFDNFSDAGLQPATEYTVSLPVFPAPATIRTPDGSPLTVADSFSFVTTPTITFLEPSRPVVHGLPPSQGGRSDDEGCLQNPTNVLYNGTVQTGSQPGASLLCLIHEGSPQVIEPDSTPRHNQVSVGTPSANPQFVGQIVLPALIMRINEPLNPLTVTPYVPTLERGVNAQLWRVGQKDNTPIVPEQVATNQPQVVQKTDQSDIILVASRPVLQGVYCIVLTPQIQDLAGNPLDTATEPNPADGNFGAFDSNPQLPPGFRLYFRTLETPETALAIQESFSTNIGEWGDLASGTGEPGVFTRSTGASLTMDPMPGAVPVTGPNLTLTNTAADCGQSTTANWNNGLGTGYRFLNLPSMTANSDADSGAGVLKAVSRPYLGEAGDGAIDTNAGIFNAGPGDTFGFNTDTGSANGDGVYEFESFHLRAGDTASVSGSKPLLILVRGDCTIDGTFTGLGGGTGGPGFDTDGTSTYTSGAPVGGSGGLAGPGGGTGGAGNNPTGANLNMGNGFDGNGPQMVDGATLPGTVVQATGGSGGDGVNISGAGGSFSSAGGVGTNSAGTSTVPAGDPFGTAYHDRDPATFTPDRGYFPGSGVTGGGGGAGGGADDGNSNGSVDNGDHGGAGGGGAGGALWVICGGTLNVGGTITANGGAGGNTYAIPQQEIDVGPDMAAGGGDDSLIGVAAGASPTGAGAPGGGGAGGAIYLVARTALNVAATATLTADGGAGGTCGVAGLVGGAGGSGRITLQTFGSAAAGPSTAVGATFSPAADTVVRYNPMIHDTSVGQSEWIDLFVTTTIFDPMVAGQTAVPTANDNFTFLTTPVGSGGAGLTQGVEFDAVWEFQGADDLVPNPDVATSAVGLTAWTPLASIGTLNGKRYLRWRWRFFVADSYPATGTGATPLPQILDLVIPYSTN